jgi:DnaJ-class molecular chaperone
MTDSALPANYYDPPDPPGEVECPECNGSGVLTDCDGGSCSHVNDKEYTCDTCDGTGEIVDVEHPDWCVLCGLSGSCPECDPPDPYESRLDY